jgi:F0F1-type ATP synthase assembly protein I
MEAMAYHRPIPPEQLGDSAGKGAQKGAVHALVQAESLMQIAFVLPCATLIGWGLGWWIDSHLHTGWITIVGLVVGMVAGMVSVIRMALGAGKAPPTSEQGSDEK